MTLNDRQEVREIFARFPMADVNLTYTIAGGEGKQVGEVIIMDKLTAEVVNLPRT